MSINLAETNMKFKAYERRRLTAKSKVLSIISIRDVIRPTWIAAKLTTNMRVVKDSIVNSGLSASSINHDRKSFYQKIDSKYRAHLRASSTNRLVGPLIPIFIQVFLSPLNYGTKKLSSTMIALVDVRKQPSGNADNRVKTRLR